MTLHDSVTPPPLPDPADHFLSFVRLIRPDFQINWHHRVIGEHLDRFARGEINRLLLLMPPRHSKSELVSRHFPAYLLGRTPDMGIIACSHTATFANFINRDVQRIIAHPKYAALFAETRLPGGKDRGYARTQELFEIANRRGYYRSAGVGGAITGMGFHVGIIDDPLKDRASASSETHRDMIWDWYTSTFYTRQEKNAGIIITLTRWHTDDLCGRLLLRGDDPDADQWTILRFPALADGDLHSGDPRQIGQALWQDKYDERQLHRTRVNLGEPDFQSLYQQTPLVESGGLFQRENFRLIHAPPPASEIAYTVRFWDLALSSKTRADYTVGVKMALTNTGSLIVLDVIRFQAEWGKGSDSIAQAALQDGTDVRIGIEQAAAQIIAVVELLKRPELRGYSINGFQPEADKYTRALPFASRVNHGLVEVVRANWTDALLDELSIFPRSKHDDIVDACAGAYRMLSKAMAPAVQTQMYAVNPFYD